MNLVFPNSIEGYVNHFADFLLEFVPSSHTNVIKTTFHFPNVMIVQGYDFSDTIYNFSKIHDEFLEKFPHYKEIIGVDRITFIDLLNNKSHKGLLDTWWFTFYNTPRPIYNTLQISEFASPTLKEYTTVVTEDKIKFTTPSVLPLDIVNSKQTIETQYMVTSSYPFGYSKYLRSIMYTSEFIAYNLFRIAKTDKISIYNTNISPIFLDEELQIKCNGPVSEKRLVSLVLDTLTDYDLEEVIEDYDTSKDLLEPIADKPWIESWKVGELVLF